MSHSRQPSTNSYATVLITPLESPVPGAPPAPTIRYPYPLIVLSLLDFVFNLYRAPRAYRGMITMCAGRVLVLGICVGLSRAWRARGGYVAVCSGVSVGLVVWTICKGQLEYSQARGRRLKPKGQVDIVFLAATAGMSIVEYLTFLLLLRLSPSDHRTHPLSLRLPDSAVQYPTAFPYTSSPSDFTPGPTDIRRWESNHSNFQPSSVPRSMYSTMTSDEEDYGDTDEGEDDASSVSESSIIDLPPPLSPSRIAPPPSLSVNRGLDLLTSVGEGDVLGAVVRRTRSARFLNRRFGRDDTPLTDDYGTFGGEGRVER